MNRLRNFSGGSVAVNTASATTSTGPRGDQDRENAWIQLKISRPMSSNR
jgi:hypothetical protein